MRLRGAGLIVLALITRSTILNAQTTTPSSVGSSATSRPLTIREAEAIALQRNPNIGDARKIEPCGHYAYDVITSSIQIDRLSKDTGVASKMFLPKSVAY